MSIAPLTSQLSNLSLTQNATSSSKTPNVHKITDFIPKPPEKPEGKSLQNRVSQFENSEEKSSSIVANPKDFPSGYYHASYEQIEEAINPWGKIKAVLKSEEGLLTFIVFFNKNIRIQTTTEYPYNHLFPIPNTDYSVLGDTPFYLRGMYSENGCSGHSYILSGNLMAFSLEGFEKNLHDYAPEKFGNKKPVPDKFLQAKDPAKTTKLLKSLKDSGLSLVEKGVACCTKNSKSLQSPSIEEIIQNYENHQWKVIHRVK